VVHGPLQRLVQPLLQWSWLTFLPLALAERSGHPLLAAGNGQFLAVRRDAYVAAGGHCSVRGEVLEDLALARRFKECGFRVAMADGTHIATCRMYESDAELIAGYTKSLHDAFGPGTIALLVFLFVAPVAGMLDRRARPLALVAYGAGVAGRILVARRTGGSVPDALAHPLSIVALAALWARSEVAKRRGTLIWRGRQLT
jgi:hypothetical protein